MSIIHGSNYAASVADSGTTRSCALLRFSGLGTETSPLRISSILRHADFADESDLHTRLVETEQSLTAMQTALSEIEVPSKLPPDENLKEVLEVANDTARTTTAYYS